MIVKKRTIRSIGAASLLLSGIAFSGSASAGFVQLGWRTGWDCNSWMNGATLNVKVFDSRGPKRCVQFKGELRGGGYFTSGGQGTEYTQVLRGTNSWSDQSTAGDDILYDRRDILAMYSNIYAYSGSYYTGRGRVAYMSYRIIDAGFTIQSWILDLTAKGDNV